MKFTNAPAPRLLGSTGLRPVPPLLGSLQLLYEIFELIIVDSQLTYPILPSE